MLVENIYIHYIAKMSETQIPISFTFNPRVVPDIPNIEITEGSSAVEGFGKYGHIKTKMPNKYNMFAFMWENGLDTSAISGSGRPKGSKNKPKATPPTIPTGDIGASEAPGHEQYNTIVKTVDLEILETVGEKKVANAFNNNNTKPPEGLLLPDPHPMIPANTIVEAQKEAVEENQYPSDTHEMVDVKETKAKKGKKDRQIYTISKQNSVKWKHPSELLDTEHIPIEVPEYQVPDYEYQTSGIYYLPPLEETDADVVALEAWIKDMEAYLAPNTNRNGLGKGKTYPMGTKVAKMASLPADAMAELGITASANGEFKPVNDAGKKWLHDFSQKFPKLKRVYDAWAGKKAIVVYQNDEDWDGSKLSSIKKKNNAKERVPTFKSVSSGILHYWKEETKGKSSNVIGKYTDMPDFVKPDLTKEGKIKVNRATKEIVMKKMSGEELAMKVKRWNEVEAILDRIGKRINPLRYTSYQLNINYFAKRHTDPKNSRQSLSCIFAVGDYRPETGSGLLIINGRPCDIKYQPMLFNGVDNPHMVLQLTEADKKEKRKRCSFVMFDTGVKEGEQLPPSKGEMNSEILYKEPDARPEDYSEEEEKRYKRNLAEMYADTGFTEKQGDITPAKWAYDLQKDVLPFLAKSPRSKKQTFAPQNTIEYYNPQPNDDLGSFHTAKSWNDDEDLGTFYTAQSEPSFYTALSGEGRQHHYSVFMRQLDDAGLLPHMFPHMMGGKMEEHGKAGEARLNPPIKVAKGTVFNRKYDEDKLYELPPLPKSDPDVKALTQYMMENELPINKSRVNSGIGRSQTVGKVRQKFKSTFNDSAFTKANPDLKTLLFNIGKKYNPLGFTSVQVNQNYECLPHIDKNNHGLSMIFAVGDYDGGDLYINDKPHNIAYKPLIFNGAKNLHYVSKITKGNRFSFVYFTTGKKKT